MEPETQPAHRSTAARIWEDFGSRLLFFAGVVVLAVGSVFLLVSLLKEDSGTGALPAQPNLTPKQRQMVDVTARDGREDELAGDLARLGVHHDHLPLLRGQVRLRR